MYANSVIKVLFVITIFTSFAEANRYWPPTLVDWEIFLNNGVAYIKSPQFATHCSYSRGQITMDGTEFNKAQYAYALSAKSKSKKLRYVVDNTQSTCIITALQEVD